MPNSLINSIYFLLQRENITPLPHHLNPNPSKHNHTYYRYPTSTETQIYQRQNHGQAVQDGTT